MIYPGVGRVRRVQQYEGGRIRAMVEPIPGKAEGVYAVQDSNNWRSLHYVDIPSVICGNEEEGGGGEPEIIAPTQPQQQQHKSDDEKNLGRPTKKDALPLGRWGSVAGHQKRILSLAPKALDHTLRRTEKSTVDIISRQSRGQGWTVSYSSPSPTVSATAATSTTTPSGNAVSAVTLSAGHPRRLR
ncbi:hypothetical protein BJX65DRAFT_287067 [Aspergillus insuetus]